MKGSLLILVGISGSGKSTRVHQLWKDNPENTVIVNRDKIRELLFGYTEENVNQYYNTKGIGKNEKLVTRYEDTLINEGLCSGKLVIVDATHLKRSYLERFKYWNVETKLEILPIQLKEAEIRCASRNRSIDLSVLIKQNNNFVSLMDSLNKKPIDFTQVVFENKFSLNKKPCVIFDIDGTIALKGDRSPYDWKKVGLDKLEKFTASIGQYLDELEDHIRPEIIICTGRDGSCLLETKKWLNKVGFQYDKIYIREEGSFEPDWKIKEDMWREIAKEHYIIGMFDDRLQVVRRARSLNLKVFNVEYNNF